MILFDDFERTYDGVIGEHEDSFSFWNRSAWPASRNVRYLLEIFFGRYPTNERAELKTRFQSQFNPAFFELVLHELLLRLGCQVTVHPSLDGTNTKPDFLARFPQGEEVYVEAVVSTNLSDEERARESERNTLYAAINRNVDSPNFFLSIGEIRSPESAPAPERIWKFIREKITGLDPDLVTEAVLSGRYKPLPEWTYKSENGFELEITAIPKSVETRGKPDIAPIGAREGGSRWGNGAAALRKSIEKKATKYGTMDKPFVVAVNAISKWGCGRDEAVEALFGSQGLDEKRDAVWKATKNTRLSAVLIARVWPTGIHDAPLCLYHNPFAKRPCVELPWKIGQSIVQGSDTQWLEGTNSAELFQLPKDWPGER